MGVQTNSPSFGGITGFQWGFSSETETNGKRPTKGAPMCIGTAPVGLSAINDKIWKKTYGASMDSFLSLVNGVKLQENIDAVEDDTYEETSDVSRFPNASNMNIYKRAVVEEKEYQQVQYVVSKDTVREASSAVGFYGDVDETRGIGIRMPSIVGGWGIGVNLLPTDPAPDTASPRINSDSHKLDRATWKYGPLDLRWDARRKMWTAYNDMIVDHDYDGLWDTFVFGTNRDGTGFPYLRAGWSDAFWVRYTGTTTASVYFSGTSSTNPSEDFSKTAELLTHTNHSWFDSFTNCAAPLSSAFVVNHWTNEYTVGSEITRTGGSIHILTDVHFTNSSTPSEGDQNYDGPLAFNVNPIGTCSFIGDIIWVPSQRVWAPRIDFGENACNLIHRPVTALVQNDAKIGTRLVNLCNAVTDYTEEMEVRVENYVFNMAAHSTDLQNRDEEAATAAADYAALLRDDCITDDSRVVSRIVDAVNLAFQELAASLLENCGCAIDPPIVEVDPFDVSIRPFTIDLTDVSPPTVDISSLDCDEHCRPIELNGPCTNRSAGFTVGIPCVHDTEPDIDTAGGTCGGDET